MADKCNHVVGDTALEPGLSFSDWIKKFNWKETPLGELESWSVALQTSVSICMYSNFPALILWGPDHIQIYNYAYRKLIGKKHPHDLGTKAVDTWQKSNWEEVRPLLNSVMTEGRSVLLDKHKFISIRNGHPEDRYYTVSYSPIYGGNRKVEGVFVNIFDKTDEVLSQDPMQALNIHPLGDVFLESPIGVSILKGSDMVVEAANPRMLEIWGKTAEEVIRKPVFDAVPDARDQGYEQLLEKVYRNGGRVILKENPLVLVKDGMRQELSLKVLYEPIRDADGTVTGILVLADDITEQVAARKMAQDSETRLKLAIEAAEIGTFEWNVQTGDFVYSERHANIFGFDPARRPSHKDFIARIHPEDEPSRLQAHKNAFETGTLYYELRIVLPDQSVRWVKANGLLVYDADQKPWRMFGTTLDITEQRNRSAVLEQLVEERTKEIQIQNQQLRNSEERYYKMIEEVQEYAIILLDEQGNIQNWNQGAEKIKGYTASEIIGKSFTQFYTKKDRDEKLPEKLLHQARISGKAAQEGWRVRSDGSRFWGSIVITALHNNEGDVIGFSKVTRDLTERKAAEEKLQAYTLELESQNRELEQFAYITSHDLQEPVRKIQTFTELIEQNIHSEEVITKYLGKIDTSAKRMSDLIKAILSYSQLSKEQQFIDVDLNILLAGIKSDFELRIQEKGAIVRYEYLPVVKGSPIQLNQLFSNLISNALKFAERPPVIEVSARLVSETEIKGHESLAPGNYYEISVSDNGIGFPQQYATQVFDIFQRLHVKQNYTGTGIGLAICKKVADNHRGHITVTSDPGKGSTFYIYLPEVF